MKKVVITLFMVFFAANLFAWAQSDVWPQSDIEGIQHQINIYDEVTEYLDEVFQKFSEGYIQAEEALQKVNLLKHEYSKIAEPVPNESEKLYQLMNKLLSQIENYFIYFKKANRENPNINLQILGTKIELSREVERLRYSYM